MDSLVNANIFSPWQKVLISILLSLLTIIGFLGNLTVSIVFSRNEYLSQTSLSNLIFNLAIADMLQCINLVFMIASISGVTWYEVNAWCQFNGFANHTLVGVSLLFLSFISMKRYFAIVKNSSRNIFARRKMTMAYIMLAWCYPSLLAIGPLVGWSEYVFYPTKLFCQYDEQTSPISYVIMNYAVPSLCPSILCFCTWKMLRAVKRANQRVEEHVTSRSTHQREERRITLMLLAVIISYLMLITPASIVTISSILLKYKVKPWLDISTVILLMVNHANNPVIYGLMNRNFRKAGLELFCRRKTRNVSVEELPEQVVSS